MDIQNISEDSNSMTNKSILSKSELERITHSFKSAGLALKDAAEVFEAANLRFKEALPNLIQMKIHFNLK